MKTNRFEENIRKKLESINPVFKEADWDSLQKHLQHQNPSSFWQKHGQWAGYGAAVAVVVLTSVFSYNQFKQNQQLRKEITALKDIVESKIPEPEKVVRIDTVFIGPGSFAGYPGTGRRLFANTAVIPQEAGYEGLAIAGTEPDPVYPENALPEPDSGKEHRAENTETSPILTAGGPPAENIMRRISLENVLPVTRTSEVQVQGNAGNLKLPDVRVPVTTDAAPAMAVKSTTAVATKAMPAKPDQESKLLPDFITNRAYRVGLGIGRSSKAKVTGVYNEVFFSPKLSAVWGLSFTEYDRIRYFNEKVFIDRTRENFRHSFGKSIPQNCEVMNIATYSTVVQMPVALTYRQELGKGFSALLGAGTNANLRFRQHVSYDLRFAIGMREETGLQFRKQSYPVLNNVTISGGLEKNFDPVIIQAEVYYTSQKNDIPYINVNNRMGIRLKGMLQFGRKI